VPLPGDPGPCWTERNTNAALGRLPIGMDSAVEHACVCWALSWPTLQKWALKKSHFPGPPPSDRMDDLRFLWGQAMAMPHAWSSSPPRLFLFIYGWNGMEHAMVLLASGSALWTSFGRCNLALDDWLAFYARRVCLYGRFRTGI
jgi:hypothetical protein